MKNITTTIILVIILTIGLTTAVSRRYYKSAERALIEAHELEIKKNKNQIALYEIENAAYKAQIKKDSVQIVQLSAEIVTLKAKNTVLNKDLKKAKEAIKDFTAGEAIDYLVDYAKITDSKMLVIESDTSLVLTIPSVKKVDDIFAEHKSWKLEIPNLSSIIAKQDGVIFLQNSDINMYKSILENKEKELGLADTNCKLATDLIKFESDKFKMQRNRLRTGIVGTVAVVVGIIALTR